MNIRDVLTWYLGSVVFIGTAGAAGYQILAQKHVPTETAAAPAQVAAPVQPAAVAAAEPAPAIQAAAPAPAESGLSASQALALLPSYAPATPAQHAPPVQRHVKVVVHHPVHRPTEMATVAQPSMHPPATTVAAVPPPQSPAPPRVTYYYGYPGYYPYAAGYPYGGYYTRYGYYRVF